MHAILKACLSPVKLIVFAVLATITVGAYAAPGCVSYVGNPNRPNTIWVPGHCVHGCWMRGHYLKILTPVCRADLVWVDGGYDRSGNWIPAHWQLRNYVIVNAPRMGEHPDWMM